MSERQQGTSGSNQVEGEEHEPVVEPLTIRQRRRDALLHDALVFCTAFSAGAVLYALVAIVREDDETFWSVGLSDGLILSGLVVAELFLLWNNGIRQGVRGHSIGKHRTGLQVVDVGTGRPTGWVRGLWRGIVAVGLLDLALAVLPIGLPTVLRRLTPEAWHVGAFAYLAVLVILVPLLLSTDRGQPVGQASIGRRDDGEPAARDRRARGGGRPGRGDGLRDLPELPLAVGGPGPQPVVTRGLATCLDVMYLDIKTQSTMHPAVAGPPKVRQT